MGRSACIAWLVLALAVGGCGRRAASVAEAARRAEPHLDAHGKFTDWVVRAHRARAGTGPDEVLAETAFAPVRRDQGVLAAWIVRGRAPGKRVSMPPRLAPPKDLRWVRVRVPRGRALDVAVGQPCPLSLPKWWRGDIGTCVLLRSEHPMAGAPAVRVVVAYRGGEGTAPLTTARQASARRGRVGARPVLRSQP